MKNFYTRPNVAQTTLEDSFWTPYTQGIRDVMIPYCFDKFEEIGYIQNFINTAEQNGKAHMGPPFSDGLVLEMITGASDFLNACYNEKIHKRLDKIIDIILSAQQSDGYLCTIVSQDYPHRKWGEGDGGDIVIQHDLYNQGALIEAAVAYYRATGSKKMLKAAVRCANNICSYIGEPPKHNVIPGHSLPEMAFLNLYNLFKQDESLCDFATENHVDVNEYLETVRFWYDNRGNHTARQLCSDERFPPAYNQDTVAFGKMRTAMGHAVRAGLCYQGAAAARRELDRDDYEEALDAIWEDVIKKKLYISGGIGARHDIEGFDSEYKLPNDGYLETCAGIAFAFWAGEMNLISKKSEYFDYFELSLYNNILGAVGKDFKHYYYDNSLVNDGTKNRWDWHCCPCCPPMLAKCYSSLVTYVYSYNDSELCVNMYVGSTLKSQHFDVKQKDKMFEIDVKDSDKKISFRIPAYAKNFAVLQNGKSVELNVENGYATFSCKKGINNFQILFDYKLVEICANPEVEDDKNKICVMYGPFLMCAEGVDNGGNVDFTVAEDAKLMRDGNNVNLKTADGNSALLVPYYLRNNRVSDNQNDSKMAVWLGKSGMTYPQNPTSHNLYDYYKIHN